MEITALLIVFATLHDEMFNAHERSISLACASVYVCVGMFSARSENDDDDERGTNSSGRILLSYYLQ